MICQQSVNLGVDLAFSFIWLMMDREAGDDDVISAEISHRFIPANSSIIKLQKGGGLRDPLACRIDHRVRKVDKDDFRIRILLEQHVAQDAVATAQIENALGGRHGGANEAQHNVDLLIGKRDRATDAC